MLESDNRREKKAYTRIALFLSVAVALSVTLIALMAPLRAREEDGHPVSLTAQADVTPSPDVPLPDLVPIRLWFGLAPGSTWCMGPEWRVGIEATVANQGEGDAGEFSVQVNDVVQTVNGGLRAHEERMLFFHMGWHGQTTMLVDSTSVVVESNEANNTLSVVIPVVTPPPPCTPTPTPGPWRFLPIMLKI